MKRFKPSTWQSRIMISWGIALLCHIPVSNKEGIYTTRFFLGLVKNTPPPSLTIPSRKRSAVLMRFWQFEAGMFPGVILQMTYWYRPDEMSIRLLYFCKQHQCQTPAISLSFSC